MSFDKTFELKEEHIKLINHMWVDWYEGYSSYGSPVIDLKEPYGNNDIILDIHEILTGDLVDKEEIKNQGLSYDEFIDDLTDKYSKLHRETETALQIILHTKSFETGTYGLIGYGKAWVKIK